MRGADGGTPGVRILSDLHLGHPATRLREVAQLRPLLEGVGEVVFNGDTFEQAVKEWAVRGSEQFGELQELCRTLGVRTHFLAGNHDLWLEGERWRDLAGGRVFVNHGDLILRDVAPWNREFLARKRRVRRLLAEFGDDVATLDRLSRRALVVEEATIPDRDPQLGIEGRGFYLSAVWPPLRPLNMLWSWLTMFREAERFVERYRPGCRVFLFGHFHRPGLRERGGRIYCNTGAFMRGARPLCADLTGDTLEVRGVEERDGLFRPGPGEGRFRLSPGGAAP